jgi:hypothetical protein
MARIHLSNAIMAQIYNFHVSQPLELVPFQLRDAIPVQIQRFQLPQRLETFNGRGR